MRRQLTGHADGSYSFRYYDGGEDRFDAEGRLIAEIAPDGSRHELVYADSNDDGRPDKHPLIGTSPRAVDPDVPMVVAYVYRVTRIRGRAADGSLAGRFIDFAYDNATGRPISASADDGRTVGYGHDNHAGATRGNLIEVRSLAAFFSWGIVMADECFSTVDLSGVSEWLALEAHLERKQPRIWAALQPALKDGDAPNDPVTEEEIDEAIEAEVFTLDESYDNGDLDLSREQYEAARTRIIAQDRERVREELLEVETEDGLYSSIAASELLAWALACPTHAFEEFLAGDARFSHHSSGAKSASRGRPRSVSGLVSSAIEAVDVAIMLLEQHGLGLSDQRDRNTLNDAFLELRGELSGCLGSGD